MRLWPCLAASASLLAPLAVHAEQTQSQGAGSGRRTTDARLNFELSIDRMIFLRVGAGGSHAGTDQGAGPSASATLSSVDFTLTPLHIPGAAAEPTNGNQRPTAWSGAAPTYGAPDAVALPVEVRGNVGQIQLSAQTSGPLTHGPHQIPMSRIGLSSDNAALPAPPIPDSGMGTSVNVSPGGSGTSAAPTLLTYRAANWTFRYTPTASPVAGAYTGRITFSAATP